MQNMTSTPQGESSRMVRFDSSNLSPVASNSFTTKGLAGVYTRPVALTPLSCSPYTTQ